MNRINFSIIFAVLGLLANSPEALAEKTGNGGGAWVCREQNGDIRWIRFVDLYELEKDMGLELATYPGNYVEIVDDLLTRRLFKANRDLYEAVAQIIEKMNYLKPGARVIYTDGRLEYIDDSLWKQRPAITKCLGGMLATDPKTGEKVVPYEQMINYEDEGIIRIQEDLFLSEKYLDSKKVPSMNISELSRAASVFHEGFYDYLRSTRGHKNSVMARKMVGLLFSKLSILELKKALDELGEAEFPETEMSFVKIQAGTFMMGSPSNEADRRSDETQHFRAINIPFEIMKTEVTQSQWFKIMGDNPSHFSKYADCPNTYIAPEKNKGVALCPKNPVEQVSWDDIRKFFLKLNQSKQDGYFYRLPTEAEWEYSARAGTKSAYFWGHDANQASDYAWFNTDRTREVAGLKPNAWGLYDMAGNVWEWVSDWYAADYEKYPNGGPASGSLRVFRGGGWYDDPLRLRAAYRYGYAPGIRSYALSFRLLRTPELRYPH